MKTWTPKKGEVERKWLVIDAKDKVLGRVAAETARLLRGKHKPQFAPHVDTGDFVVVINAEKVKLTGKKEEQKIYQRFSGYRSGLKKIKASTMRERHPERLIQLAVKGMMPKNNLARNAFRRLKVYAGDTHPHKAQAPKLTELV